MKFETSLEEINGLDVGRIEETIKNLEDIKYTTEKTIFKKDITLEDYESSINEKLPKIIDNIFLLSNYIREIGHCRHKWFDETESPYPKMHIKTFNKKSFSMWINYEGIYDNYGIQFDFTNKSDSIKNIFMYTRLYHGDNNKRDIFNKLFFIQSNNPSEFSKKYSRMLINQIKKEGSSVHSSLPEVLNKVPLLIEKLYKSHERKEKHKLDTLNLSAKNLNELDVTDF